MMTHNEILRMRATLIENMNDVIIVLDHRDCVLDFNTAASNVIGHKAQDIVGKPIKKIWPYWSQIENVSLNEAMAQKEAILLFGEEERIYKVNFSDIYFGSDNLRARVIILQDITTQKRAKAYWENLQKQYSGYLERLVDERTRMLREKERMAVIGELAAMVGHDLRNPLTGISGAMYYIKTTEGHLLNDKNIEMLDLIEKKIEESNKIINDLLDYSREIRLEITNITMKSLISECLSNIEIPKGIEIVNQITDEYEIEVDQQKINRVFINIIRNAFEAMPFGGSLTISERKVNNEVKISFMDTGIGIPDEIIEDIWRPLFTTKAKGMGFGLAISKRMVEAHRGSISVSSMLDKGTVFTVKLPIKQKKLDSQIELNEPIIEHDSTGVRV